VEIAQLLGLVGIDPYLADWMIEMVGLRKDSSMHHRSFAQRRRSGDHQVTPNRSHTRSADVMPFS